MKANHVEENLAQQSGSKQAPTLLALRHLSEPIASGGLRITALGAGRVTAAQPHAAFMLLVMLAPMAEGEIPVDGKRDALPGAAPGDTSVFDTAGQPVANLVFRSQGGVPAVRGYAGSGLAPWQLRRVHAFVEANLDADPSVADLAGECRLSPSHFARAFSRSVGTPPHKWLVNRRIERAKELLRDGGQQLAQVALSCGFVDQSHFTRAFTRSVGQSPGRWRRQHRH